MKIYVVESKGNPPCFFKANDSEEAREVYEKDFLYHPPVCTVRELTMEILYVLAPDAFKLDAETSF